MNVIDKLAAILLFISCIALRSESNDEFTVDFESNMIRIPKKCYHSNCYQGACLYEGCKDISCTGGACHFIDCSDASCEGGSCVFERSKGSKCGGGSCTFRNVEETLQAGYCQGGNCNIEGQQHPDMHAYITI